MADVDGALTELVKLGTAPAASRVQFMTVAEAVGIPDALSVLFGMVVVERLRLSPTLAAQQFANLGLAETIYAIDSLANALPVGIAEQLSLVSAVDAQRVIQLVEQLQVVEAMAPAMRYNVSISQRIRLAVALGRFFGADVSENIALSDALVARALAAAGISDTITLAAGLTPKLLLSVTAAEDLELDAVQALQMLYNPTLDETVEIRAGYLEPNGSLTTWAMNVRTAAVTEYSNYPFNSFAQIGDRYIAAADDGLYELLGDDDDGEGIVAKIRGGFLQFGGPHLSRVKEAYIATRGEGEFVLKIETGDGAIYQYGLTTRDMRSTKVHMGKGMRARYFAYELTSAGQDFDLDTLEFVPLVVQRRV